jgi:hypothetical protein
MVRFIALGFLFLVVLKPIYAQDLPDPSLFLEKKEPVAEAEILPDLKANKKTNPEKIIFSHYKLAKAAPDIDKFARLSPRVLAAQDIDKSAMTISEYNRMSNKYNLLNPKEPIIVHASLKLDEYSSLQNIMVFDELNEKTYFEFPVYEENIAIIPENIAQFGKLAISKDRADGMFEFAGVGSNLMAEFILLPKFADRKEPFVIEDTSYWLMLAKIAEIRIWVANGEGGKLVWYYRSPDYSPKDKQELNKLYSESLL